MNECFLAMLRINTLVIVAKTIFDSINEITLEMFEKICEINSAMFSVP
jgi:hypothetical protein